MSSYSVPSGSRQKLNLHVQKQLGRLCLAIRDLAGEKNRFGQSAQRVFDFPCFPAGLPYDLGCWKHWAQWLSRKNQIFHVKRSLLRAFGGPWSEGEGFTSGWDKKKSAPPPLPLDFFLKKTLEMVMCINGINDIVQDLAHHLTIMFELFGWGRLWEGKRGFRRSVETAFDSPFV